MCEVVEPEQSKALPPSVRDALNALPEHRVTPKLSRLTRRPCLISRGPACRGLAQRA
jgi:hypothetical protein